MITPDKKFWDVFRNTEGALSCAEALAIIQVAALAPSGVYVEAGTHKGKSALAACFGLQSGKFYLIDPIFEDNDVCKGLADTFFAYPSTHIEKVLEADISINVLNKFGNDTLAYCMLDSGDHDQVVKDEVRLIEDKMVSGGMVGFHDIDSQFISVRYAYNYLISTGKYEPVGINWGEIIAYCEAENLEDGTNKSWHHNELKHPQFFGALRRK